MILICLINLCKNGHFQSIKGADLSEPLTMLRIEFFGVIQLHYIFITQTYCHMSIQIGDVLFPILLEKSKFQFKRRTIIVCWGLAARTRASGSTPGHFMGDCVRLSILSVKIVYLSKFIDNGMGDSGFFILLIYQKLKPQIRICKLRNYMVVLQKSLKILKVEFKLKLTLKSK